MPAKKHTMEKEPESTQGSLHQLLCNNHIKESFSPRVNMYSHTNIKSDRYNFNLRTVFIILELHNNYVIVTDKHCQQTLT